MGIQQALFMVGPAGSVSSSNWNNLGFSDTSISGTPALAAVYVFLEVDGRFTVTTVGENGGAGGSSTTYNWFTPTTTNIGTNYWVRATASITAGVGPSSGSSALNTWLQLNVQRGWYAETGPSNGNAQLYQLTLDFSTTSDGSNIVATGSCTLEAENFV